MKPVYKKVKIPMPHCPQCGEQLRGNNSVANPWKCRCGVWKHEWGELGYTIIEEGGE